ncbi:helix-turn-helix transcriptional regulator [Gordonia sp. TBRC 11910]|uniref:Helix-turn-helix transcriptional regulator n=1 Tax=Gordonia asplenii TaxID=2725283 RepID=A0A848KVN1_9ACTN|nr:helix-turn-helix transcriptional regulator [Gordonia asplenii]NMO02339.1 helix-turn-helix transcriptional regulator [Gordonia asplenii]
MEPAREPMELESLWREVLGEYLRSERKKQRRILTEVAAVAGVSPQYLSEIERGRKEPSSEILAAVTGALGLTLFDVTAGIATQLASSREVAVITSTGSPVRSSVPASSGRVQLRLVA